MALSFTCSVLTASTFFLESQGGVNSGPLPFNPDPSAALTEIRPDVFLVEDGDGSKMAASHSAMSANSADSIDPTGGGSTNTFDGLSQPANVRNYTKYGTQDFVMLDTNSILLGDNNTNLYEACADMPQDTNSAAILVIARYNANSVIIRADNFDQGYSYTNADFALLVCDNVADPIWKPIDFGGASDAQDGWLVQGRVRNSQVSSTMFMMVTNLNTAYNAVFCAIPYSGPQVAITGTNQPNDTVSNTITLTTQILDLSGTTNEQFNVDVGGLPARYSLLNNSITLDTRYNPNNYYNVDLDVQGLASVYGPPSTNTPEDVKTVYEQDTSIYLAFDNDTYLVFQSDAAQPDDIGTNYMLFNISKPQTCAAIITDPSNGNVVFAATNYISSAGTVEVPWNFTEGDGVTPYSNDTYAVTFIAFDPSSLNFTNYIDRAGMRQGAGVFATYETEDPENQEGYYIDQQDQSWIDNGLAFLYNDIYDQSGLTEYTTAQAGANRNCGGSQGLDAGHRLWAPFLQPALTNYILDVSNNPIALYSDFDVCGAHGNGSTIGGGPNRFINYLGDTFTPADLQSWLLPMGHNWRLRKIALWSCYSGNPMFSSVDPLHHGTTPLDFMTAAGIRPANLQNVSYIRKNCALAFHDLVNEIPYNDNFSIVCAQVADTLDQTWVCGPNQYPGGCDPTYSFRWAIQETINQYPEMINEGATIFGYFWVPYTSVYDDEILVLDRSHVKDPAN